MEDKIVSRLLRLNLFLMVVDLLTILWKRGLLPEKVPLFYSRPWGEEQLTPNKFLFLIPLLSFVAFILSWQISRLFLKKGDQFLAILNSGFALLFSALGTFTLEKIIFLMT